jgi:integrase
LTARFVETVKPAPRRKEYPDPSGLRLIVQPSGHKSWAHRYRGVNGKTRKDTLGPAIGEGAITLAAAREAVARARRQLDDGVAVPRPVSPTSGDSVANQAALFMAKHHAVRSRPGTIKATELTFNNSVLPAWGRRAVTDIRRRDVIELVEATTSERGPAAAKAVLQALSRFFKFMVIRDIVEASPTVGVSAVLPPRPKPRQRTLSDDELVALLKAARSDNPFDRVIWVLALTGVRRNEAARMRWSELDPETRIWTIPAERAKNHRPHTVQLSTQAWAIIEAQPRLVDCDFVFSIDGVRPINNWDRGKKRLSEAAGLVESSWRIHDIRRTVASGMQRSGIRTEVIERALAHHSGHFAGIVGTYQVSPLENEVRAALQRWADHVEDVMSGGGRKRETVVRLRRRENRDA